MVYTIKKLADLAGVSIRLLHYYDELGLLKPQSRSKSGYRYYGEEEIVRLQQIMFFRELGFGLKEIGKIISSPDFDMLEALQSHHILLSKKADRIIDLMATIDKTIKKLKGELKMQIKDYYQGFSDEQIEIYREEVRQRWGEKALQDSEERVIKMGKEKFAALQAEGEKIFQSINDNMSKGFDDNVIQTEVGKWRQWLEHFHHYSEESILGLGRAYSQSPEFVEFFQKINKNLPEFLTKAIECYCYHKSGGNPSGCA